MSGYSKTPLVKKLGIKQGSRIFLFDEPPNYIDLLVEVPENIEWMKHDAAHADFIHCFVKGMNELEDAIVHLKPKLSRNGMLWVSWPKGSSGVQTSLNRDIIREYVLSQGLVDVKVASIDDTWSGLKFVYRLHDR